MDDLEQGNPYDAFDASQGSNPYDSFDRSSGTLGSIEKGADKLYGAGSALVEGIGGGVAAGYSKLNRYLGMSLAGLGVLGDAVHSAVTGQRHTENQDFAFEHFVEPTDKVIEHAEGYTQNPIHPQASALGGTIGELGSEMATMVATDGGIAPGLAAPAVRGAVPVGRLVEEASSSPIGAAVDTFGEALRRSTGFSALPASVRGAETGEEVYKQTDDPARAAAAGLTQAGLVTLTDAFPVAVDGKVLNRIATGALSGVGMGEASRQTMNDILPEEMHQDFGWGTVAENALFSAAMGVAFHGPAAENPGLLAQRYNGLRAKADQGDAHAAQASTLVGDLTAVDGLSGAALDAAEFGAKAGQAAKVAPHEELIASSDRYRQIYQSARPDLDPQAAEQYARAAYAQEVATNSAWTAYTEAKKLSTGQQVQAKVASEIKSMLTAAQQTVPTAEMNKLARWAFSKSRGTLAVRDALRQTVEDRKVPDFIEADQGGNFYPDGALTEDAFRRDNRADLVSVRYPDTPEVAGVLRKSGVVPYRLNDGTLAVLGHPESVDAVTGALTEQGLAPAGEDHGKADLHPEAAQEGLRPAEGAEGGHPAAARDAAETGQPAEALGQPEGQAEVKLADLPEDMQVLIHQYTDDYGAKVPASMPVHAVPVADFPTIKLDENDRGTAHANAMDLDKTPPVLVANGHFLDGKHRLFKARAEGRLQVQAIDLTGLVPDKAIADNSMGRLVGKPPHISTAERAQPVVDKLVEGGVVAPVNREGVITLSHDVGEQAARHALETAAGDTFLEPTEAQAKAGNYRKGGVLFKSPKGDLKVRIETPDGAVRKGPGWSRKIRGAHYGYIPGTRAADGDPVDVLLTRHAHDDSRPVAVINQHWKDGLHDEIKVVLGAKDKAEALETYAKQYPPGMLKSLLPNGKRNIVMMSREKFMRYLKSGETDVPPHPVSGRPMAHLRRERRDDLPTQNASRAPRAAEATVRQAEAPAVERGPAVRRLPEAPREAPPAQGLKRVASDAPVYQHGQGAHPVSAVGVHYSEVPGLTALDPAHAGTGAAGRETRRYGLQRRSDDPLDRPLYFYVRSGKGLPPKEAVVTGTHAYESRLNNLYDVAADPEGIVDAGGMNKDAIMEDIHDAGYDGVILSTEYLPGMPAGHVVQLFGDAPVPVKAAGRVETPRAMFAGRGAQHASLADLKRAKALEGEGADAKAILQQTGWARGKDGRWRFELSDRNAHLTDVGERVLTQPGVYHLGDVLDHPGLYRAYPDLKAMPVTVVAGMKGAGYHPTEDSIYIHQPQTGVLGPDGQPKLADLSLNLHAREIISQLLHEAQHAVQAREGFEGGAGIRDLDYNTRAGEVEARNVMGRRRLTDEQRRQFTPEYTEDVPREKQTVPRAGLSAAEAGGLHDRGRVRGGRGRVSPAHRAGVRPVEGLPATVRVDGEKVTFGPNPRAVKAAEDYAKSAGLPYTRLKDYAKLDTERAGRIAQAYEEMQHAPDDPEVKAAYAALIRETQAQWEAIKKTGLKVEFMQPGQPDPYAGNPRKAIMDVNENNHLWVFPTDAGFGSDASIDVHDNPLLALTGEKINGHALRANDVFRIVHDYFGHVKEGFGFRAEGEENAWRSHSTMYSPLARRAMTSETRGQNSWLNYGPYGESNRTASLEDTHYADQKVGLLPDWVIHEGAPDSDGIRAALRRQQTDTPAFKHWFGDSKVVDAEGEPLVVYHSSTFGDFDRFDKARQAKGMAGYGFYFSDADGANVYADYGLKFQSERDWQGNPKRVHLLPVYLSMQHPLVADNIADVYARYGRRDPGAFGVGRKYAGMDEAAKTALQRDGYDGVISNEYVAKQRNGSLKVVSPEARGAIKHPVYVVFEPEQIKSATGNSGTFDPANPNINAALKREPTLYSGMEKTLEAAKNAPKRAPAKTWVGWLDGAQRRGEIKQGERDWIGIDRWLAGHGDEPITRDDVLSYIKQNTPKLEVTRLGQTTHDDMAVELRTRFGHDPESNAMIEKWARGEIDDRKLENFLDIDLQDIHDDVNAETGVKYGQYTLPGGENYQEHLLTVPVLGTPKMRTQYRLYNDGELVGVGDEAAAERWRAAGETDIRTGQVLAQPPKAGETYYRSVHWQEHPNVLVHVRMDDRSIPAEDRNPTSAQINDAQRRLADMIRTSEPDRHPINITKGDVKKAFREGVISQAEANTILHRFFGGVDPNAGVATLKIKHIHEVQSDWHQEGRKNGYHPSNRAEQIAAAELRLEKLNAEIYEQARQRAISAWADRAVMGDPAAPSTPDAQARAADRLVGPMNFRDRANFVSRDDDLASAMQAVDDARGHPGNVPDAPFKQTKEWSMLGIKHAVLEAIRDGSDAIEWDTGATNADRYSLRKVVETLRYNPRNHVLVGYGKGGGQVVHEEVVPEKLPDYIGKEAAEKLLASEPDKIGMHVLTGAQLEVGGKGMTAFYDKLLVNEVNQWAKRFGGKVESAKTPVPLDYNAPKGERTRATVHRLMITPAMRAAASDGLPMFHIERTERAPTPAKPAPKPVPHEVIARHVDTLMAGLKGRASYAVHRIPDELPGDDPVRQWFHAIGAPDDLAGTYYNGRMYLFTDAIRDKAEAERVTLHEMVGHGGMRAVFGDDYSGFLREALPAMRKTALFGEIEARYREQMPDIGEAELADEYMAALAEDTNRPDARPVWKQLLAVTRNWLRSHGFKSIKWSENDLKELIRATYRGIRDGRISVSGREVPQVIFDEQAHMSTATYVGAKGARGFVDHFDDGSRDLRVGGLEATGLRVVERDNLDFLDVTGQVFLSEPHELIHLARFAGEEQLDGVLLDKAAIDLPTLQASGVPFRDYGDAFQLSASRGMPSPMASLRNRATGTAAQEAILKKAIAHDQYNMGWGDRVQKMARDIRDTIVSGDGALSLKQSYVDALASVARYERQLNGGLLLDAAESAYKLSWQAQNTEQILAGVMKVGVPVYKDGSFVTQVGRKGLMDIFAPLYQTADGKALDMLWEGYAYARRANELIDQLNADGTPREKLLSRGEIDELLALEKQYPVFKKIMDEYQTFNQQLLDLAVDRGALSPEMADLWKQNTYVPFYRALEDNAERTGFLRGKGLSGKKVTSMRLHGSENAAQPIIENIIKNSGAILDKVYSNEAMRRVVALTNGVGMERVKFPFSPVNLSLGEIERTLQKIGLHVGGKSKTTGRYIHFVPQAQMDQLVQFFRMSKPVGHDIVSVMEGGKPVYYKVTDPMLLRAVTAFNDIGKFDEVLGAFLGVPKRLLTRAITLDPRFMYRNLIRDTITTWVQTGSSPNLLKDMAKNAKAVFTDSTFLNQLRVAGYNGNEYYRVNELREHLHELHGNARVTVLNTPKKLYDAYHRIGYVSEQMNRVRVAQHVLERGGSMAEAAWQAQNVLNFQMRGDSRAMQLLIRAVPFLNARIQGLNRLYDGMVGRAEPSERRAQVVAFLLKAAGLGAASLALDAWNWDDPRYQRIPEASKDTYYHFFVGDTHYILPKPFEIGAITGTVPERVLRVLAGKDNTRTFVDSMKRMAFNTFQFDPREGALWAPLLQDWANKDSYSGIPIVSLSEQGQLPGAQYDAMTSRSMIAAAHAMPAWAPDMLRSPDRLEHLMKGYTGTLGSYFLLMADGLMSATGKAPTEPTSRYGNKAVGALLGTFGLGDATTDPRTKYLAQFYDAQQMADQASASLRKYIKEGHVEEAREVLQDNRTALAYRTTLHGIGKQMKALRQAEIAVYQSTSLSADEKRARLTRIQQTRVKLLDRIGPMLDLVTDYH